MKHDQNILVLLPLRKSYFEDYLRWHFNSGHEQLAISLRSPLGKMLYGHISVSFKPVPKPEGERILTLRLPTKDANRLPSGFYYYHKYVIDQINDLIDFYFDTDFRQYCLVGLELGMQRKEIYESFLKNRNIVNSTDFYERLKKRDYRRRQSLIKLIDENSNYFGFQQLKK